MKQFEFFEVIRRARLEKQFHVSPTARNWPLCLTCGREVESVNLEHESDKHVEIKVRCHGAEDSARINFPFKLNGSVQADGQKQWAIIRILKDWCPFDPTHVFDVSRKTK